MSSPETLQEIPRRMVGSEPGFSPPDALAAIRLCTRLGVAVLGFDVFEQRADGIHAAGTSTYDQRESFRDRLTEGEWKRFVDYCNSVAEECVKSPTFGSEDLLVLTTSTWAEYPRKR